MPLTRAPTDFARQHHRGMGHPTKCTPEVTAAIAEDIAEGMPPVPAAIRNGVAKPTHHRWMATALDIERRIEAGETVEPTETEERYRAYRNAVARAELDWLRETVSGIKKAAFPHRVRRTTIRETVLREGGKIVYDADGKPRTAQLREVTETEEAEARVMLALLERRFPEEFSPTFRAEVTGADGGPIAIEVTEVEQRLTSSIRQRLAAAGIERPEEAEVIDVEEVVDDAPPGVVVVDDEPEEYVIVPNLIDEFY